MEKEIYVDVSDIIIDNMNIYFNDSLLNSTMEKVKLIHWMKCGFTENSHPTELLKLLKNRF